MPQPNAPATPPSRDRSQPSDPLSLALEVLDSDPEEFPEAPELLFARSPSGLPSWWPAFNPDTSAPWTSPQQSRAVLLERLERTLPVGSLRRPLTPSVRQNVVNGLRLIASELRSMGFDTPV